MIIFKLYGYLKFLYFDEYWPSWATHWIRYTFSSSRFQFIEWNFLIILNFRKHILPFTLSSSIYNFCLTQSWILFRSLFGYFKSINSQPNASGSSFINIFLICLRFFLLNVSKLINHVDLNLWLFLTKDSIEFI